MKNRGREIIPLQLSLAVGKVTKFSGISELMANIRGDGAYAAIIHLKCGNGTGQN
jgi:hypothetical protein